MSRLLLHLLPFVFLVLSVAYSPRMGSRVWLKEDQYSKAQPFKIRITSQSDTANFSAHFESKVGFSITSRDGVTPATYSVEAKSFNAVIDPKQDANIRVQASFGGLGSSRSGSGPVRIVKDGGDFSISPIESEKNE